MPSALTYPGVYIEEIPSGVRTITGVSTSDTAFIDYFKRGPMNKATRITSLADFERVYGGLDANSAASYAIAQYFLNGGAVAWVVRVASPSAANTPPSPPPPVSPPPVAPPPPSPPAPTGTTTSAAKPATFDLGGSVSVEAESPGTWANKAVQVALIKVQGKEQRNLVVRELAKRGDTRIEENGRPVVLRTEIYRNVSMKEGDPNYIVNMVDESTLVKVKDSRNPKNSATFPQETAETANGEPQAAAHWKDLDGGTDGAPPDAGALKDGLKALDAIAPFIFNILCLPRAAALGDTDRKAVYDEAETFCRAKRAFLIMDIPETTDTFDDMVAELDKLTRDRNAAIYFPRVQVADPLNGGRLKNIGASGAIAGVYARTDAERGVWKAPAGTDAVLRGVTLPVTLNDADNGGLNPLGVNVLRNFPIFGNVVWGARTLDGADAQASEWKYIPVRRTALYIEESLFQGLKWVVFEPNDEPLWASIRLNVGAFMQNLFRQGAFAGRSPREAYFVRCDKTTTTQNDINLGIVNIIVGFAPLKPAEFVVVKIQQMAGQVEV